MGNRHIHTPISSDASLLLDIGCGTGAVSLSMAMANPQAKVIGVDLSRVPAAEVAPSNLSFLEADVLSVAGKDKSLAWNSADLVFSRLLVLGLKGGKWPQLVKTLARLVKPGGTLEMVELTLRSYEVQDTKDILGSRKEVRFEWQDAVYKAASMDGYDLDAGEHLEHYMHNAGLEDVQVREYVWPMGHWIKEFAPETSEFNSEVTGPCVAAALAGMMAGKYPEDQIRQYEEEARQLFGYQDGLIQVLRVVTGRKLAAS